MVPPKPKKKKKKGLLSMKDGENMKNKPFILRCCKVRDNLLLEGVSQ